MARPSPDGREGRGPPLITGVPVMSRSRSNITATIRQPSPSRSAGGRCGIGSA